MAARGTLLEEALESWGFVRAGVIAELENIPPDRMDYRPAAGARSIAEIVRHIIQASLMWCGELSRPDGDFTRQSFAEHIAEYGADVPETADRGELLELLRSTHEAGQQELRDAGNLHMLQLIRRFDGEFGTRLTWLHHGIEHESHHRGQITVYARMIGAVPALTKRIHGDDAE